MSPAGRAPSRRPVRALIAAAAMVMLLTACGARLDTVLTLDGTAGTRVMTATLSTSDLQYVTGGTAAIDASIRTHLPPQLAYSGLTESSDSVRVAFTLTFSSPDDYEQQVRGILAASGSEISPDVTLTNQDTAFLTGVSIAENFSSADLLDWLANGLVADGIVDESNKSSIFSSGSTAVDYGGASHDTSQPLRYDDVVDRGFSRVSVETTFAEDGTFERTIGYVMPADVYTTDPATFDAWLAAATPEGGSLEKDDSEPGTVTWSMSFAADDAAALDSATVAALGGTGSGSFSVSSSPSPDNPLILLLSVVDDPDCSAICSPDAEPIQSVLRLPDGWSTTSADATVSGTDVGEVVVTHDSSPAALTLARAVPMSGVTVRTTLGYGSAVIQELTFAVRTADAEDLDAGLRDVLTPPEGGGSLDVQTGRSTTSYTVSISSPDARTASTRLAAFLPGSSLSVVGSPGLFRTSYTASVGVDLAGRLPGTPVTGGVTYVTRVPFGQSATGTSGADDTGRTSTVTVGAGSPAPVVTVRGWTPAGLVVLGALAILAIAAVVAGVLLRRRIAAWASRARAARARRHPSPAVPSWSAAVATVPAPAHLSAAPGCDERGRSPFSEADLV